MSLESLEQLFGRNL